MEWLLFVAGLLVGAVAAWLLGRAQAKGSLEIIREQLGTKEKDFVELRQTYENELRAHEAAKARLQEAQENLAEQKQFVEASKKQLEDAFKALSKDALDSNTASFANRAQELVNPLAVALDKYQQQTHQMEAKLKEDYGSVGAQLRSVVTTTQSLQKATDNLGQALRSPQVRGRWGELTLRRVAELAGMTHHCDFTEQVAVDTENGPLRPDMIMHLPGDRQVVVDSKVSLDAYLKAVDAPGEEERAALLERHLAQVKEHMRRLSAKSYWNQFPQAPDFVVMFIPGESFFSAALELDHALIEDGMRSSVILASPTTLLALLRAVAMGWRQEQIAENAAQISRLGAEIHDRLATFVTHFGKVGGSLEQATKSFNSAVGTLESRVLVSARKFRELGATPQPELPEIAQIEHLPRTVQTDLPIIGDNASGG